MKGPLYLTPYNGKQPVCVEGKIVENLSWYQVDGVRFLYQHCVSKNQNVILNNESGMNEERQICSFLTTLTITSPSLIVCQRYCLSKWYYEFCQANLKIVTADELIKDDSWENSDFPDAVLLTHDQLKHIKTLPLQKWFFFIIQNLENLEKSRYIKNVNSKHRIGIINQSYLDLTPELQWFAMKWANSDSVEEKDKFMQTYNLKTSNFLWPFPDYWKRITWETVKKYAPTQTDFIEYEQTIKKWCKENKPILLSTCNPVGEKQKPTRKRTSPKKQEKKNNCASKRRRVVSIRTKRATLSSDSEDSENISISHSIQSSSGSDTQDLDDISAQVNQEFRGKNFEIQNNVTAEKIIKGHNPCLLDESKESCILDSLFDSPKPTTSKPVSNITIKDEQKSLDNNTNEFKNNSILDSLIDSPEPDVSKKQFNISDDENETCPILDKLFEI